MKNLNVLLFCDRPHLTKGANTIDAHINAFLDFSEHNLIINSGRMNYPPSFDLELVDVVVIHYSMYLFNDLFLTESTKKKIAEYTGLKVLFLQDEYRKVNQMHSIINYLGIDLLFTCVPDESIDYVYPQEKVPKLKKVNVLTGYTPDHLLKQVPPLISERSIDVGYRSRKLSYWYGKLGYDKWRIADDFYNHTKKYSLKLDLSYDEEKRIYGEQWFEFIKSCKATLGVEGGSSAIDFTGELEKSIETLQETQPEISFEEVRDNYLINIDNKFYMNKITPRCFEAIALKTALVLFEGHYSGVLIPNRHYIPLKKDFSNIDDVVCKLQDVDYLQNMVDTAYKEVGLNEKYSYKHFIRCFDRVVSDMFEKNKTKYQANKNITASGQRKLSKAIAQKEISYNNKWRKLVITAAFAIYRVLPGKLRLKLKPLALSFLKKI